MEQVVNSHESERLVYIGNGTYIPIGKDIIVELDDGTTETSYQSYYPGQDWAYGTDDQGNYGFCVDPNCNCEKFLRYD